MVERAEKWADNIFVVVLLLILALVREWRSYMIRGFFLKSFLIKCLEFYFLYRMAAQKKNTSWSIMHKFETQDGHSQFE